MNSNASTTDKNFKPSRREDTEANNGYCGIFSRTTFFLTNNSMLQAMLIWKTSLFISCGSSSGIYWKFQRKARKVAVPGWRLRLVALSRVFAGRMRAPALGGTPNKVRPTRVSGNQARQVVRR